jgi:hypothetical protein
MALSESIPAGGSAAFALTQPNESWLNNYYNPLERNAWGSYVDSWEANYAKQQQRSRERAMTEQMTSGVQAQQADIQKRNIINALLGGGKVRITGDSVFGSGTSGVLDPTKQFERLIASMGGQDEASINAQIGAGGQGDYQQLYNQLSSLMAQRGSSYEDDIRQSAEQASKTAAARMAARGLGGSTLVDASNARLLRDRNAALNKLHDTLLGQDIGTLSTVGIEGLKARQRQAEFLAQMKLAASDRNMKLLQTLLGS